MSRQFGHNNNSARQPHPHAGTPGLRPSGQQQRVGPAGVGLPIQLQGGIQGDSAGNALPGAAVGAIGAYGSPGSVQDPTSRPSKDNSVLLLPLASAWGNHSRVSSRRHHRFQRFRPLTGPHTRSAHSDSRERLAAHTSPTYSHLEARSTHHQHHKAAAHCGNFLM